MSVRATIPKALQRGDTIAFVSPSERLNLVLPASLERAKCYFERLGYIVRIIFTTPDPESHHESVKQRCEEIHRAFREPDIKAIICTIGGTTSNELLPHLDYQLIKDNPKIFCGLSDITLLHYALLTQSGLHTFYGPTVLSEIGAYPEPLQFTMDHFFTILQGPTEKAIGPVPRSLSWAESFPDYLFGNEASQKPQQLSPSPTWKWIQKGSATGRIIGGCLTTLLRLPGTKFWPDNRGRILFFETPMGNKIEDELPLMKVRSCMADLANTGVFQEIKGLIVGRPYGYDEKMREELARIVVEQCYGTDFPILLNVDISHSSPMLTIPMNALVRLDSETDDFSILEPGVMHDGI